MDSTSNACHAICARLPYRSFALGTFFHHLIKGTFGMTHRRILLFVCSLIIDLALSGTCLAQAQGGVRSANNRAVPSPRSILGFSPGEDRKIADWSQITNYFAKLDESSNRVSVQTVGQTTLKRPILAAFISAPENILALNKYKEIQRKLSDPRTIVDDRERNALIAAGRVVVVISCSIHSTEIVASQMSMQLAFDLATSDDADTTEILKNTILILIPSANPDGIDIVADWYRKTLGTS